MSNEASKYIATVFAIAIVALIWNYKVQNTDSNLALVNSNLLTSDEEVVQPRTFPSVTLQAKAAVVYDFSSNKFLYELNADAQLPLASLTKLMTVYTALKNAPIDHEVQINQTALASEGDFGLILNDNWTLGEISQFSLVNSANDGAEAIAESIENLTGKKFVEMMTETGKEMGLSQTYFINPTGLDESKTLPSGYGSARDIAKLAMRSFIDYKSIYFATTFTEYVSLSKSAKEYRAKNTNQDTLNISGLRLSKTGFTDIAGGNLAIVMEIEPNRPIAIVVIGSSKEGRFLDVNNLANATIEYMAK